MVVSPASWKIKAVIVKKLENTQNIAEIGHQDISKVYSFPVAGKVADCTTNKTQMFVL